MRGVLITGANGNVGSRLVREYLDHPGYKVFALVRGKSPSHAMERMTQVLDFWGVPTGDCRDRLTVLQGDVCQENLGLKQEQIETLRTEVQLVVHAASNIRLDQSLESARAMHVGGTKNVLALAQALRHLERFGFVSTLEVVGDYEGVVYEEFLTDYKRNFLNTYEIGKFETEEFLRGELGNGVPITIFRLGMVVGEAATGKALDFQSFYLMLEKMLLQPVFRVLPHGCPVDTIPVDVMAEGIMKLLEHPEARGQIYHFSQGLDDRVTFDDFLDKVQPIVESKLGKKITRPIFISPAIFHVILAILSKITYGKTKRYIDILLIFIRYMPLDWKVDSQKMRQTLESLGMQLPRFDDFLPTLLGYYLDHRHENKLPF